MNTVLYLVSMYIFLLLILILISDYVDINNPLLTKIIVAISLFIFNLIWKFMASLISDDKISTNEITSHSLNDSLISVIGVSLIDDLRRYSLTNNIIETILQAGGVNYLITSGALFPITFYRILRILFLN